MDYDNDSLHLDLPSQTAEPNLRLHQRLRGFEFARCYTIGPGIVTPRATPPDSRFAAFSRASGAEKSDTGRRLYNIWCLIELKTTLR
ncbi:MAG TPA: hypothetical protein VGD75_19010, partial [Bradyrhizobium sp.]